MTGPAETVRGEEHYGVGHVCYLAEAALRGEPDDGADGLLHALEQPERHHVLGELVAHLGGHQAGAPA